jgi:ectoine hydroxylase-related dioxygenase (phytanoyl-CoA dioxygenase family)
MVELDGTYPVRETDVEEYERKGHVVLRSVFTAGEIAGYRPALADFACQPSRESRFGRLTQEGSRANVNNGLLSLGDVPPAVAAFVTSPRLGGIAARLLGVERVRLLHFSGLFKPCGSPATPWHQDALYLPLETDRVISAWIPLTETTHDMAGLVFADGSHRSGPLDPGEAGRFPLAGNGTLRPGDVSFHASLVLHASVNNSSPNTREAVGVCLYADGVLLGEGQSPFAQALRSRYFPGLRPGDPAVGPTSPIVFHG